MKVCLSIMLRMRWARKTRRVTNGTNRTGAELRCRYRRTAGKLAQRRVAHVLQVRDADLACIETIAGHLTEKCEERHALAE